MIGTGTGMLKSGKKVVPRRPSWVALEIGY